MNRKHRPLLGVVTTTVPKRLDGWRALEQAAHDLGLRACLFRPQDLDADGRRVDAWFLKRTAAGPVWRRRRSSIPDVVYENVYVHLSRSPSVLKLRRFFEKRGVPLFNPRLGHKGELAAWLRRYPDLWEHHPETSVWRSATEVFALLERHPAAYLKPVNGSAGRGILEIRTEEDGRYRLRSAKYGARRKPLDLKVGRKALTLFLQKERQRGMFILQAGCDLLHIDGGKIDLRTHLQRNRDGEWVCLDPVVKQGRAGSIVSNYHAGGSTHEWEWLRERVPGLPDAAEVIDLSKRIAAAYAEKAPLLGSIGLDIGIDEEGRLWLLDVNARPGRNILDRAQKERCKMLNAEFAAYLWKRRKRQP